MRCHSSCSPAVVRTWEDEQAVVAEMTADNKAALYILPIHQHQAAIAKLAASTDVARMNNQLVGTPLTTARRKTTAIVQRVQLRGGMVCGQSYDGARTGRRRRTKAWAASSAS